MFPWTARLAFDWMDVELPTRDDILVTAHTAVEHSTTFISTAQLDSSEEHLLSSTLVAGVICDSLGLAIFGRQSLDRRALGSQSGGEGRGLRLGDDTLRNDI
jgi:hypothetical protein